MVKNGCFSASVTVIRFSGSTTKHLRMRSLGSSVKTKAILVRMPKNMCELRTGDISPFRRSETVLSFHYIAQHNHLLAMPERRTANQQCEHYNATGPTWKNLHNFFKMNLKIYWSKCRFSRINKFHLQMTEFFIWVVWFFQNIKLTEIHNKRNKTELYI